MPIKEEGMIEMEEMKKDTNDLEEMDMRMAMKEEGNSEQNLREGTDTKIKSKECKTQENPRDPDNSRDPDSS